MYYVAMSSYKDTSLYHNRMVRNYVLDSTGASGFAYEPGYAGASGLPAGASGLPAGSSGLPVGASGWPASNWSAGASGSSGSSAGSSGPSGWYAGASGWSARVLRSAGSGRAALGWARATGSAEGWDGSTAVGTWGWAGSEAASAFTIASRGAIG